jgi:5-methylcytosine-specific restriction enzyme A
VRKALAPCSVSGCPTLTRNNRCPDHEREADRKRGTASERGYDHNWQKIRKSYLERHPFCEVAEGCIAPATDVDHIDNMGPRGDNSDRNLMALCHSHHSRKTSRETPGGWNRRDEW